MAQRCAHLPKGCGRSLSRALVSTAITQNSYGAKDLPMPSSTRDTKQHAKANKRRYLKAQERLARDCRQAQHAAQILEQALEELGLPTDLVECAGTPGPLLHRWGAPSRGDW